MAALYKIRKKLDVKDRKKGCLSFFTGHSTHSESPLINYHGRKGEELSRSLTKERRAASDFFSPICIMHPLFLKLMFLLLPELNKWPLKN